MYLIIASIIFVQNKQDVIFIIKFPRHQSKLLSKIANANYSGAYVTTYIDIELLYLNKI